MNNLKRLVSLLTAAMLVASIFSGCGDKGATPATSDSGSAAASTPAEGKTVVEFWHALSDKNGEVIAKMAEAFNATHDNIEVVATYQGGYWDAAAKAQSAVAAGENPDVLMMGADHVSIFASEDGLLADLTPYLAQSNIEKTDFVDAFIWDYYTDDKLVALPFGRSTPVMYVNKDMMAQEGHTIPTTWEELETVSNALVQQQGSEVQRFGVAMPYDTWYWFMTVAQAGGSFINAERTGLGCVEDGTMLNAFTYLQNLHNSNALYFSPTVDPQSTAMQVFLDKKSAMLITSVGSYNNIKSNADFEVELAWVPKGKEQVVPTGGSSVVMMEASPNKDAAWEFMRWVVQEPEGGLFFVMNTGYLPYTYSMTESAEVKEMWANDSNLETAFKQLEFASDRGHRVPQTGTILNELLTAVQAIMYDNEDVQKQIDILAESVADIME